MKMQQIAIALTAINLVLSVFLLAQLHPSSAQQKQNISQVLRGRALELTDSSGNVRASIQIQPPSIVNGKSYAQNVILRLIDEQGKPLIKLGAGEDGGGLYIDDGSDHGIQLITDKSGNFIRITNADGKEQVIKP